MSKRIFGTVVCLALLSILLPALSSAGANHGLKSAPLQAPAPAIALEPFLAGLASPVFMTNARDGSNRLFILEQGGIIKVLQPNSNTPTVFLDISDRVLAGGEQGLLGLAFHPLYSSNGRFFVYYSREPDAATVIAEYRESTGNPNVADRAEKLIIEIAQPFTNHKGGTIEFGPDGFLYLGTGDGGSANDPGNRAQNINELLGKMLRIDVNTPVGGPPYFSPSTNPFFGSTPGRDEIYATGFRNPYRWSFDRTTGQLIAADVGQGQREEIDIVTLGGNYGWRVFEGTLCTGLGPAPCTAGGFTPPIAEYSHTNGRCSITGGYVYRGTRGTLPTGAYVYGDFCTGEIFMLHNNTQTLLLDTDRGISSFGQDETGELYVVGLGGTIERIVSTSPPPPPAPCTFSINPTSQGFEAGGGSGSFAVDAGPGCNWSAVSHDSFILILSGVGSGDGVVTYRVGANKAINSPRVGRITVAGQTFTVIQKALPGSCPVTISPAGASFPFSGGSGSVRVTAASSCSWGSAASVNWITINANGSGTGVKTLTYTVASNPNAESRTGFILIGDKTFTVTQAGGSCFFSLTSQGQSFGAGGGISSVGVVAPQGCAWNAVSHASWLLITGGSSGSGNGTVNYSVAANNDPGPRTGMLTIAGETFTVTQSGASGTCAFSISPSANSLSAAGGGGSVTVTATAGCAWTAVSNADWVHITSGSNGTGSGSVNYTVDANGAGQRSGTMTIAGQAFTVTQSGASSNCSFSISPPGKSFLSSGGTASVAVTAAPGCAWTAVSNASWIVITSGKSGSGNGTVTYSVSASGGVARTGTITIAGLTHRVTQK
jgi:glucose/arabinose dehydrogenase